MMIYTQLTLSKMILIIGYISDALAIHSENHKQIYLSDSQSDSSLNSISTSKCTHFNNFYP